MKIEYRIPGGAVDYTALADDSELAGTQARISGYQPSLHASAQVDALPVPPGEEFSSFIISRAGQINVVFSVARQHGTADAALAYITQQLLTFSVVGQWHLKITVGGATTFLAFSAITMLQPDPHSDQSSVIRYAFTGSIYTTEEPA